MYQAAPVAALDGQQNAAARAYSQKSLCCQLCCQSLQLLVASHTDRFLGLVKFTGEIAADSLTMRPYLSHGVGTEVIDPFTTSQGAPVEGSHQRRRETALGADFAWNVPVTTGTLTLDGGFGLVDIHSDEGGDTGNTFRLRLGLERQSDTGLHSFLNLFGQGGGSLDARTYGVDLGVELSF